MIGGKVKCHSDLIGGLIVNSSLWNIIFLNLPIYRSNKNQLGDLYLKNQYKIKRARHSKFGRVM